MKKPALKKKPAKKSPGETPFNKEFLAPLEYLSDDVYLIDLKGNIVHSNRSARKSTGYALKKMESMHFSALVPPESAARVSKQLKNVRKYEKAFFESEYIRKNGTALPVEVTARLLDYKRRKIIFIVVKNIAERKKVEQLLLQNNAQLEQRVNERIAELRRMNDELSDEIDKRKRSEQILEDKEKRFRAVAMSTSDLIWEGDVRSNMLTWFGDIDSMLGYEVGEFPHTISGHMESVHPNDREILSRSVEEALETGSDFNASYRIRRKDGKYLYWNERGKAIDFEQGKAVKWVGSITNITEQKKAERKLLAGKNRFKKLSEEFNALLNSIPDDLILLNAQMKIQWANRAFANKFNKNASELYGKNCYRLCCNISTICRNCPVTKSFRSGREETTQVMDSEGRVLDKRAFPILDASGKVINVIELAKDISAKIRMEEEAKLVQSKLIHANKMTSLGTLVSGVAHEINNPNSFILHNAGTLSKIWEDLLRLVAEDYNEKAELIKFANIPFSELQTLVPELLEGIKAGSSRIKNIVSNLKDFSRPEEGLMNEAVNVNTIVMTSRSILENHIKKCTDHFKVECGRNIPLIHGSAQKIEQVVINIVLNALQALTDRENAVIISTVHNRASKQVIITVKDEGTGIPENIIERVTEPFFTTRFDAGGTGLGLSISYGIVKEHRGLLEFKSNKGNGTTVSIKFPAIE